MDNAELAVLRVLRLKGRAGVEDIATASGVEARQVSWIVSDLTEVGAARELKGNYMLLPPGREKLEGLLEQERAGIDAHAMSEVHESFTGVNLEFKQLATDWQIVDGEPNEHTDEAYDQSVIDRLPAIHERVMPIATRASELAPRLAPYGLRFTSALERVQAGDHAWLLKPLIDSYHTVWFEFHEELIALAGLTREAEAASGRAD
jgi:hypothetical protein